MDEKERKSRRSQSTAVPQNGNIRLNPPENDTIDLVELALRLLNSWKLIACACLIGAVLMGVYSFCVVTPMYQATSTIYVLSRRDTAINMSDLQIGTALTKDYIKVFQMWEVHEQVIGNLDLPYTYKQMQDMLTVENDSNTRMLDIRVKNADPELAAKIANEYAGVVSRYIAETMATEKPNVVSVALPPANPVSPNKTRNILLGIIAGMALSCGYVTVRMLMDDKYKTAEDIRRYTGLPTLATVPLDENQPETGHDTRRKK